MGKYEITFREWDACVSAGGCGGYRPGDNDWGRGDRPVIHVNWRDAKAYVAWLKRETGAEYQATVAELYQSFETWWSWGIRAWNRPGKKAFGIQLGERGFPAKKGANGERIRRGLRLK